MYGKHGFAEGEAFITSAVFEEARFDAATKDIPGYTVEDNDDRVLRPLAPEPMNMHKTKAPK